MFYGSGLREKPNKKAMFLLKTWPCVYALNPNRVGMPMQRMEKVLFRRSNKIGVSGVIQRLCARR